MDFITAEPKHASEIAKLVNQAYRGDEAKKGWTHEADLLGGTRISEAQVLELIADPDSLLEMGFENGELRSTVHLKFEPENKCYLGLLTVSPTLQGQGRGKEILKHGEDKARSRGCKIIRMTVLTARTELLDFYMRRGYKRTENIIPFSTSQGHVGDPKVPNLALVELTKQL